MNSESVESVKIEKYCPGRDTCHWKREIEMLLYQYLESGASLKDRRQVSKESIGQVK
jgi:hypothetical protein